MTEGPLTRELHFVYIARSMEVVLDGPLTTSVGLTPTGLVEGLQTQTVWQV
jgi:hypothetical protein